MKKALQTLQPLTIAVKSVGGFKRGPFQLMDFIGNDVNYTVTQTVFEAFYNDPRYKPSFTQKRFAEAGYLGRKSGKGFYDYSQGAILPEPENNPAHFKLHFGKNFSDVNKRSC